MDELTRLLLAAGDGDRTAMHEFVHHSQADVWKFCAALLGAQDAADAAQDTFVRAWRSAPSFRGESSAKTWLLTIAKRTCYELSRKRRRRPSPSSLSIDAAVSDRTALVDIDDLIARLEPDRRTAIVLTQILGLSYEESAAICGCPIGTIRSRVARARSDLIEACADFVVKQQSRGGHP